MADQDDEELQMALKMSMMQQDSVPVSVPVPVRTTPQEPKRNKPCGDSPPDESPEIKNRRLQRELMAAAAEKRMTLSPAKKPVVIVENVPAAGNRGPLFVKEGSSSGGDKVAIKEEKKVSLGQELAEEEAKQLFSMVFGGGVTKDIIAQWTNQGIRFSTDPETSMGLVQHEGGPCGVLAAIQAFVLKYLVFFADELGKIPKNLPQNLTSGRMSIDTALGVSDSLAEDRKTRALIRSMGEILFSCGSNSRAVIATLSVLDLDAEVGIGDESTGKTIAKALEGLPFETASDLQKYLRVTTYTTHASAFHRLEAMVPVFESRMGALLFLLSALLSRGLDSIQSDRDDPSLPLVTAPFGHASQEIVNLLLCGQAVPNVFDGRMDFGGGMFLKGISTEVEVGFLTLLESLNFCKVGQNLKRPKWPIWVIGSESHYTVLFALESNVQDENELEDRESRIRKAFDAQDQSGGGGFISVEGFQLVLQETRINLPNEKLNQLCSSGFIVWSEFWQVLLDLEKHMGGLKDPTGLMGKKVFDLYHFNGIAKSVINGNQAASGSETPVQRPRLTKLRVSVPPKWTPEEFMATVPLHGGEIGAKDSAEVQKPEAVQHAPLVDCIRTRWPRAVCNWVGDPPSIV